MIEISSQSIGATSGALSDTHLIATDFLHVIREEHLIC